MKNSSRPAALFALLLLPAGCLALPAGYEGINLFPLYRQAAHPETGASEFSFLWPFFSFESRRSPGVAWAESPSGEDRFDVELSLFPYYYLHRELPLESATTHLLFPLWGRERVVDRATDEVKREGFSLAPLIVDELFSYESWRGGEAYRFRFLFEQFEFDGDRTQLRLLDLVRGLPVAELLRVSFESDHGLAELEEDSGSEWILVAALGFRLLRTASLGGYREVELVTSPLGERASLFRWQQAKHVEDQETWLHLFPLFHYHREAGSTRSWVLWPLYSYAAEGDAEEQRWLHFLRWGELPAAPTERDPAAEVTPGPDR